VQEESRRLVGAERQRVAGMIYKEALQARTLEEQAAQLETLTAQLGEAQAAAAGRDEAIAQRRAMEESLAALSESRARDMDKILALDELLGEEQQRAQEAAATIGSCQRARVEKVWAAPSSPLCCEQAACRRRSSQG